MKVESGEERREGREGRCDVGQSSVHGIVALVVQGPEVLERGEVEARSAGVEVERAKTLVRGAQHEFEVVVVG